MRFRQYKFKFYLNARHGIYKMESWEKYIPTHGRL